MAQTWAQQLAAINKKYAGVNNSTKLANGKTMKIVLEEEAMRLQRCIENEIDAYYNSYTPHTNPNTGEPYYERTYRLKDSLTVDAVKQIGNSLSIRVYFNENATHKSIFGGEDGFLPVLLTHDWKWRNDIGLYHLSYYDGSNTDFINSGILAYNKANPYGLTIQLHEEYDGKTIEDRMY